jgi:hypothetical protein
MRLLSMKKLLGSGLFISAMLGTMAAHAQCLPLVDLTAIAASPSALTKPQALTQLPAGSWTFKGTPPRSKEIQWLSAATSADADGVHSPAMFSLRPFLQSFDVVLKTTEANCVRNLRSELKNLKLTPVPVTCPGCEAVRYDGPGYQATLYSKMKGDYPFIVVVHPLAATPVVEAKTSGNTTTP